LLRLMFYSQSCEGYNRKLFNRLPKNFPDSINCKDLLGKKQGWWIYYKVEYNPSDIPDELRQGEYVPEYVYGEYKDNKKIGTWITVFNVHLISEIREDIYYYSQDTSRVTSKFAYESDVLYLKDSTIIKSTTLAKNEKHPICIECDKIKNSCVLTYRKQRIKMFPFDKFDLEFEGTFFMYEKEKKIIDEKLK